MPLWLLYIKKPWGLISHPWLFIPILGMALWVTLFKIKVKVIKIKTLVHGFPLIEILNILVSNCQGNFKTTFCWQNQCLVGGFRIWPRSPVHYLFLPGAFNPNSLKAFLSKEGQIKSFLLIVLLKPQINTAPPIVQYSTQSDLSIPIFPPSGSYDFPYGK